MRVGIDLVEHKDIENKDERFVKHILTEQEYTYYTSITNKKRRIEYLSSRFACKEAIFKCYQTGVAFQDITILNDKLGAPYVLIHNKKVELSLSLSHTDNYSVAIAILPSSDDD
ncbi:MAG: holo-ACP synthase [Roseburia sp.]|nr:holo-ACP synthase [Anaeroplasma bactoclasticum]MCM1195632.1 holo-ACP synthase [Roseburia sp.]MCM1556623.1 holo-ACP synthase [Anaeroplasma bactoclasticum]